MNIKLGSTMYEKFTYPAGEMQVRIKPAYTSWFKNQGATVYARIHSHEGMIETSLLCSAITGCKVDSITLVLPYLPYGRADRRFVEGDCFGRQILVNLFSTYGNICSYDVHSQSALVENISPEIEIEKTILDFARQYRVTSVTVLFPDKGALERYSSLIPNSYQNNVNTIFIKKEFATKKRNPETGKFEGFNVPNVHGPTLIIDDICDGGGTFVGIAEVLGLRDNGLPKPFGLYTSHGIYSKGLEQLTQYFDRLYCVDTFRTKEEYFKYYTNHITSQQLTVWERFF